MARFAKVLIANRGEIARRIVRTLRRLGVATVALYHELDRDSPLLREADECVRIDGATPVGAYLSIDNVVGACLATGAQAVHPGFGFLAENPQLPRRLAEHGVAFIGPAADAIATMGDKLVARRCAERHGVPLAPCALDDGDEAGFIARAHALGAPLLVKAAAGGGGKGMQIVRDLAQLPRALGLARAEAARAFGDARVYAERYVERPRHIEVQVFGDTHGNLVALGERECSIQRRFQKVIEEAPAPNLDPAMRATLLDAALRVARAVGYVNAGTVEFIVDGGDYYFLEMNTRLQVEHALTEMVTGLDLVELQLRVAEGERLPFGSAPPPCDGHAIEARLYAEDVHRQFAPATGRLLRFELGAGEGVRVDSGYAAGTTVHAAFDPMLAKVIAHGRDRAVAIAGLAAALDRSAVHGVASNLDLLRRVVAHAAFVRGELHTGFLAEHRELLEPHARSDAERTAVLAAALLASPRFDDPRERLPEPLAQLGAWRN